MVNKAEILKYIEQKYLRSDLPSFGVGDTIKMMIKGMEGEKVRLFPFEGIVISKRGSGSKATFTVRKISFGEGVERTFPIHSPIIESIKVINRGNVKRSKLYYLRYKSGKQAKIRKHEEPVVAVAK
ncbi:MAG: 50S ribosomal protein L19 [Omnitrophica WOR_2 bacterium GWA2_47_8]|nr:MAG: 50S ribosomal protein L19 [Omnitrophica WOR_2 bacterium GWA2_47_8]